ncbi:hypothetical protein BKH46_04905 [Helicobacter sp. 12S02634-8]|uniref:acyltransferase n=1 Tax=Helicobacter sp. 12S02634-8 TaxID=1476199 RepID=UPI000BA5EF90|nr:hypothetical protein [Helicobacter sp. 12S02634-8]PAF47063.1 hypothetical protein BKH46_04905 [Helicobacter sp. 12S02634-8]
MDSFYHQDELLGLGFRSLGSNVLLSKKASIYNAQNISIASNVRIDDFVILSGHIHIGNFVHIASGSVLMAKEEGIFLRDYAGVSIQCKILGSSDDFSGGALVGPCIPMPYRQITSKPIILDRHSLLGCGSIILPGGGLAEGVSVGAASLILRQTKPWGIYFGAPAKRIAARSQDLLELEKDFLSTQAEKLNGGGGAQYQSINHTDYSKLSPISPSLFSIFSITAVPRAFDIVPLKAIA